MVGKPREFNFLLIYFGQPSLISFLDAHLFQRILLDLSGVIHDSFHPRATAKLVAVTTSSVSVSLFSYYPKFRTNTHTRRFLRVRTVMPTTTQLNSRHMHASSWPMNVVEDTVYDRYRSPINGRCLCEHEQYKLVATHLYKGIRKCYFRYYPLLLSQRWLTKYYTYLNATRVEN